ncbi:uncharacterized protein At2g33490-like isoform X3 [Vitis riparia]|uniref:uncharacterized protein At2g33490-like isoform X3 n=1 Tax=Vitis riparia TaxID=96939 RepID=UPI00155B302E|nr:uncharacterized protein At2g33490-like isoform X3 [Vitis riparia]
MKTSLRKLRGFALHRQDVRERRVVQPLAQLDELVQATQDMQDMRNCYDTLLSAAAATANSAYEFSESLKELGGCLLEKTALNEDEESGKVLLKLGKVQYELQKLVDSYRSHIFQTIVTPSESLLKELRTVEEMKRQCDEKRDVYEYMITRQREKGRSRSGRGETFSSHQVQAACDEYDEEATLFVFRLKSLKQGQSRSLLTQASRHHAAQLSFFRKALKSLEVIEPHVKLVTEQQHIDYKFSGLEDDDWDDGEDDDDYDGHDGDLSFDYGQIDHEQDFVSTARNSMELDQEDLTFPQVATMDSVKLQENLDKSYVDSFAINSESRKISQSAPLFAEKKFDSARMREMRPLSTRKLRTYVLPTPDDTKSSAPTRSDSPDSRPIPTSLSGRPHNLWHSSPLEPKYEKILGDDKVFESTAMNAQSVLKESNTNHASSGLPPPLVDGLPFRMINSSVVSDTKKVKRYAFSGPLTRNPWSTKPGLSASDPLVSVTQPQLFSGPLLRSQMPHLSSSSSPPRVSPIASPFLSSPKINELHELPRPPSSLTLKPSRPSSLIGHSAPLVASGPNLSATNKLVVSSTASRLPLPLQAVPRSFSTPSSGQKLKIPRVSGPSEAPQNSEMAENVTSPPLTPISLSNIQPASTSSVNDTSQLGGAE